MRIITPTADFGLNLLRAEVRRKPGKNVVISPLSVSLALGMTYNGARGATATEMASVLGIKAGTLAKANAGYAQLLDKLAEDLGVELAIANAIYAEQSREFNADFISTNKRIFKAEVATRNFSDPQTLVDINDFAAKNTKQKILKILEELDPNAIMVLLNAVYFKGIWTTQFRKRNTDMLKFYTPEGSKDHPIMFGNWSMDYAQTDTAQVVRLPFGPNQRVRLYAMLPTEGHDVADVLAGLTGETLSGISDQLYSNDVRLWLPRVENEYESLLNDSLCELGMPSAFGDADFSGMRPIPPILKISRVVHKTFFKMDEKGAEGAAVTAVEVMEESCVMPSAPIEMNVDHPFIKLVVDEDTGALLFAGVINNPEWNSQDDGIDDEDESHSKSDGEPAYELLSGGEPEVLERRTTEELFEGDDETEE